MFPRNPGVFGRLFAQAWLAAEIPFAVAGLRAHLLSEAVRPLVSAIRRAGFVVNPSCDPSLDPSSGPARTGRLSPDRQGSAHDCVPATEHGFSPPIHALHLAHRTILNGGRACVFLPLLFSRHSRWQLPAACNRAAATMAAMAISLRLPTRCKPRAAVRWPGPLSAPPSPTRLMKTWSPGPRLARWPVAPLAAFRACRPAVDLTPARKAALQPVTRASRGIPPAGPSYLSRACRPACR